MLACMSWINWADRFRKHLNNHGLTQEGVGGAMVPVRSPSTVGNWLSGHNKINLVDFFAMCEAAGAPPHLILFGEEMKDLAKAGLDALALEAPSIKERPSYRRFEDSVRKAKPGSALPKRRRKSKVSAERRVPRRPRTPPSDRPAAGDD